MTHKLKIIPLGGLGEIGKNMTAIEFGSDIIVIDCGLGFPDEEMYGVDLVIADMTYLVKNKDKIRGMFLTHGHEDHIGGIPYAMQQFNCPIHATRLTAGIVQLKLEEHQLQNTVHLFTHEAGEKVKAGCFTVEFIHVNHSIADAVAFAIKTPVGTIVMTGDFKIDATAEDGMIDLARFGALGKEGVLALLCDSTNVERQGYTPSEKTVAANFERQFSGCNKRIIVTTFASNMHRIQAVLAIAHRYGRKVAVTGGVDEDASLDPHRTALRIEESRLDVLVFHLDVDQCRVIHYTASRFEEHILEHNLAIFGLEAGVSVVVFAGVDFSELSDFVEALGELQANPLDVTGNLGHVSVRGKPAERHPLFEQNRVHAVARGSDCCGASRDATADDGHVAMQRLADLLHTHCLSFSLA